MCLLYAYVRAAATVARNWRIPMWVPGMSKKSLLWSYWSLK